LQKRRFVGLLGMAGARANIRAEISADTTKFQGAMRRAQTVAQATGSKIGQSLKNAGASLGGLAKQALKSGAALGAMAAAVGGAIMAKGLKMAADLGGRLSDIAARTGIAAGQLLLLERAFADNGIAVEKIGPIINKMQKAIVDATTKGGAMADTFADLGLNLDDLRAMSPEDQFTAIQKAISGISDPAKRAAMAMQLFGKSGGALLTLFADKGAFENAGKFVGSQAEIMNRSAGVFDAISDKLGRIPDKLKGFFVGFLEPISGALDGILTKFEAFDFAASGLKLGESFMRAIEMVRGALDSLSVSEMFELAGLLLKVKLMEAGNEIFKTVSAVVALFKSGEIGSAMESAGLLFQSVLFNTFSIVAKMLEEAFGPDSTIGKRLGGAAFSMGVSGKIAEKEREALNAKKENGPSLIDRFKEERSKIGDAFQIPDSDIGKIEDSFQKIRIAADEHTADRMKKAAQAAADFAGGVGSPNPPMPSMKPLPNSGFSPEMTKILGLNSKGPIAPHGPIAPSKTPVAPVSVLGGDDVFSKARANQGVASEVSTGGLFAKRKVGASQDTQNKKQENYAAKQVSLLEDIETNISAALTVA
jgi:hypothetical protein